MQFLIILNDINTCLSDFNSNGKDFLYALGAIKNVGYEAITNVIKERIQNGKFENIALGYIENNQYLNDKYFMGALIGRYANRISNFYNARWI